MHYRTELVFDIGPGKEGGLLEGFAGSYRFQEGLEWAEERLKGVGFTKREEGNRVSYRREIVTSEEGLLLGSCLIFSAISAPMRQAQCAS